MSGHTPTPIAADLTHMPKPPHGRVGCRNPECQECLNASLAWKAWAEQAKPELVKQDALGLYHLWLSNNGIRAELHGWMSPEAWDAKNVEAFLSDPFVGPAVRAKERADECVAALADRDPAKLGELEKAIGAVVNDGPLLRGQVSFSSASAISNLRGALAAFRKGKA